MKAKKTILLACAGIIANAAVARATVNSATYPPVPGGAHLITAYVKIPPKTTSAVVVYKTSSTGTFVLLSVGPGPFNSVGPGPFNGANFTSSTMGNLNSLNNNLLTFDPAGLVLPKNDTITCNILSVSSSVVCEITGYTEP